jgi:hypothetical protein
MRKRSRSGAIGLTIGLLLAGAAPALAAHRHHGSSHRHHDRAYAYVDRSDGGYAWAPRRYGGRGWSGSGDVNERLCSSRRHPSTISRA